MAKTNSNSTLLSSDEEIFEVDRILNLKYQKNGQRLFLVRWLGYGPEEDTWEPYDNLQTCKSLVEKFLAERKKSVKATSSDQGGSVQKPKRIKKRAGYDVVSSSDEEFDTVKDHFWKDLEEGKIKNTNDLYSSVKSVGRKARPSCLSEEAIEKMYLNPSIHEEYKRSLESTGYQSPVFSKPKKSLLSSLIKENVTHSSGSSCSLPDLPRVEYSDSPILSPNPPLKIANKTICTDRSLFKEVKKSHTRLVENDRKLDNSDRKVDDPDRNLDNSVSQSMNFNSFENAMGTIEKLEEKINKLVDQKKNSTSRDASKMYENIKSKFETLNPKQVEKKLKESMHSSSTSLCSGSEVDLLRETNNLCSSNVESVEKISKCKTKDPLKITKEEKTKPKTSFKDTNRGKDRFDFKANHDKASDGSCNFQENISISENTSKKESKLDEKRKLSTEVSDFKNQQKIYEVETLNPALHQKQSNFKAKVLDIREKSGHKVKVLDLKEKQSGDLAGRLDHKKRHIVTDLKKQSCQKKVRDLDKHPTGKKDEEPKGQSGQKFKDPSEHCGQKVEGLELKAKHSDHKAYDLINLHSGFNVKDLKEQAPPKSRKRPRISSSDDSLTDAKLKLKKPKLMKRPLSPCSEVKKSKSLSVNQKSADSGNVAQEGTQKKKIKIADKNLISPEFFSPIKCSDDNKHKRHGDVTIATCDKEKTMVPRTVESTGKDKKKMVNKKLNLDENPEKLPTDRSDSNSSLLDAKQFMNLKPTKSKVEKDVNNIKLIACTNDGKKLTKSESLQKKLEEKEFDRSKSKQSLLKEKLIRMEKRLNSVGSIVHGTEKSDHHVSDDQSDVSLKGGISFKRCGSGDIIPKKIHIHPKSDLSHCCEKNSEIEATQKLKNQNYALEMYSDNDSTQPKCYIIGSIEIHKSDMLKEESVNVESGLDCDSIKETSRLKAEEPFIHGSDIGQGNSVENTSQKRFSSGFVQFRKLDSVQQEELLVNQIESNTDSNLIIDESFNFEELGEEIEITSSVDNILSRLSDSDAACKNKKENCFTEPKDSTFDLPPKTPIRVENELQTYKKVEDLSTENREQKTQTTYESTTNKKHQSKTHKAKTEHSLEKLTKPNFLSDTVSCLKAKDEIVQKNIAENKIGSSAREIQDITSLEKQTSQPHPAKQKVEHKRETKVKQNQNSVRTSDNTVPKNQKREHQGSTIPNKNLIKSNSDVEPGVLKKVEEKLDDIRRSKKEHTNSSLKNLAGNVQNEKKSDVIIEKKTGSNEQKVKVLNVKSNIQLSQEIKLGKVLKNTDESRNKQTIGSEIGNSDTKLLAVEKSKSEQLAMNHILREPSIEMQQPHDLQPTSTDDNTTLGEFFKPREETNAEEKGQVQFVFGIEQTSVVHTETKLESDNRSDIVLPQYVIQPVETTILESRSQMKNNSPEMYSDQSVLQIQKCEVHNSVRRPDSPRLLTIVSSHGDVLLPVVTKEFEEIGDFVQQSRKDYNVDDQIENSEQNILQLQPKINCYSAERLFSLPDDCLNQTLSTKVNTAVETAQGSILENQTIEKFPSTTEPEIQNFEDVSYGLSVNLPMHLAMNEIDKSLNSVEESKIERRASPIPLKVTEMISFPDYEPVTTEEDDDTRDIINQPQLAMPIPIPDMIEFGSQKSNDEIANMGQNTVEFPDNSLLLSKHPTLSSQEFDETLTITWESILSDLIQDIIVSEMQQIDNKSGTEYDLLKMSILEPQYLPLQTSDADNNSPNAMVTKTVHEIEPFLNNPDGSTQEKHTEPFVVQTVQTDKIEEKTGIPPMLNMRNINSTPERVSYMTLLYNTPVKEKHVKINQNSGELSDIKLSRCEPDPIKKVEPKLKIEHDSKKEKKICSSDNVMNLVVKEKSKVEKIQVDNNVFSKFKCQQFESKKSEKKTDIESSSRQKKEIGTPLKMADNSSHNENDQKLNLKHIPFAEVKLVESAITSKSQKELKLPTPVKSQKMNEARTQIKLQDKTLFAKEKSRVIKLDTNRNADECSNNVSSLSVESTIATNSEFELKSKHEKRDIIPIKTASLLDNKLKEKKNEANCDSDGLLEPGSSIVGHLPVRKELVEKTIECVQKLQKEHRMSIPMNSTNVNKIRTPVKTDRTLFTEGKFKEKNVEKLENTKISGELSNVFSQSKSQPIKTEKVAKSSEFELGSQKEQQISTFMKRADVVSCVDKKSKGKQFESNHDGLSENVSSQSTEIKHVEKTVECSERLSKEHEQNTAMNSKMEISKPVKTHKSTLFVKEKSKVEEIESIQNSMELSVNTSSSLQSVCQPDGKKIFEKTSKIELDFREKQQIKTPIKNDSFTSSVDAKQKGKQLEANHQSDKLSKNVSGMTQVVDGAQRKKTEHKSSAGTSTTPLKSNKRNETTPVKSHGMASSDKEKSRVVQMETSEHLDKCSTGISTSFECQTSKAENSELGFKSKQEKQINIPVETDDMASFIGEKPMQKKLEAILDTDGLQDPGSSVSLLVGAVPAENTIESTQKSKMECRTSTPKRTTKENDVSTPVKTPKLSDNVVSHSKYRPDMIKTELESKKEKQLSAPSTPMKKVTGLNSQLEDESNIKPNKAKRSLSIDLPIQNFSTEQQITIEATEQNEISGNALKLGSTSELLSIGKIQKIDTSKIPHRNLFCDDKSKSDPGQQKVISDSLQKVTEKTDNDSITPELTSLASGDCKSSESHKMIFSDEMKDKLKSSLKRFCKAMHNTTQIESIIKETNSTNATVCDSSDSIKSSQTATTMLTAFSNDVNEQQSVSSNKTEEAPLNEPSPMHSSDKIEYLENTDPLQSCKEEKSVKSFPPAPSENETGLQPSSISSVVVPVHSSISKSLPETGSIEMGSGEKTNDGICKDLQGVSENCNLVPNSTASTSESPIPSKPCVIRRKKTQIEYKEYQLKVEKFNLSEMGFDLSELKPIPPPPDVSKINNSDICKAVKDGNFDLILAALEKKGRSWDFEQPDQTGVTLVMLAAQSGNNNILELLARNRVDLNATQKDGTTALMMAVEKENLSTVALLLEMGAFHDSYTTDGETALTMAIRRRNRKIVRHLLHCGVNFSPALVSHVPPTTLSESCDDSLVTDTVQMHINEITSAFDALVRRSVEGVGIVLGSIFPVQCLTLRDGVQFNYSFMSEGQPLKIGHGILLYFAHAYIKYQQFQGELFVPESMVREVHLNGRPVSQMSRVKNGPYIFHPLIAGVNEFTVHTRPILFTDMKLVFCAYHMKSPRIAT